MSGKINWWIEGEDIIEAKKGDIIFAPKTNNYKIKTVGNQNSLRLAISPLIFHIFIRKMTMLQMDFNDKIAVVTGSSKDWSIDKEFFEAKGSIVFGISRSAQDVKNHIVCDIKSEKLKILLTRYC